MADTVKVTASFEFKTPTGEGTLSALSPVDWVTVNVADDDELLFEMIAASTNLNIISVEPVEEPVDEFTMAVVHAEKSLSDE